MRKREFLDTLRTQLEGALSPAEIEGHLHYYNEYITQSVASGRTEAEVMEELGSPVMIARTLIDSAKSTQQTGGGYERQTSYEEEEETKSRYRSYHISPFVAKWVIPIVIILILFLILFIVGRMVALVARFFVPIMVVVLVIAILKVKNNKKLGVRYCTPSFFNSSSVFS